jgi:hypothetical protein
MAVAIGALSDSISSKVFAETPSAQQVKQFQALPPQQQERLIRESGRDPAQVRDVIEKVQSRQETDTDQRAEQLRQPQQVVEPTGDDGQDSSSE